MSDGRGVPEAVRARVRGTQVFASQRSRRRFLLHVSVAGVAIAAMGFVLEPYLSLLSDPEALRAVVLSFGVWGPLVFVLLHVTQVVVAPVPGQVFAVVSGYLFGAWWGTLYNVVGITVGSAVAFWLSRRYGRRYVESVVHDDLIARFDAVDDDHARLSLFVVFLVPGLPDDAICFVGGLTRLPLWQLVLIAAVGRAPAFFLVNVVGDFVGTGQYRAGLVLAAALVAVTALVYLHRDRLVDALLGA